MVVGDGFGDGGEGGEAGGGVVGGFEALDGLFFFAEGLGEVFLGEFAGDAGADEVLAEGGDGLEGGEVKFSVPLAVVEGDFVLQGFDIGFQGLHVGGDEDIGGGDGLGVVEGGGEEVALGLGGVVLALGFDHGVNSRRSMRTIPLGLPSRSFWKNWR